MARKRIPGKSSTHQDEKPVKLNLSLSPDLARRFGVHAEMVGKSKSELFADLVRAGCRRFVVSDRASEPGGAGDLAAEPDAG